MRCSTIKSEVKVLETPLIFAWLLCCQREVVLIFPTHPCLAPRPTTLPQSKLSIVTTADFETIMVVTTAAAESALALKDHSAAVSQFFGSIRVPCSFLAGASFSGLFSVRYTGHETATDRRLKLGYSLSIFLCFLLTITTLVFSTAALTKNLNEGYNPMTSSGIALLNSDAFHYEFVMTRWSFQMGIMCYLTAAMNRILLEFNLLTDPRPKIKALGISVCLLMSSLMLNILSFVNTTLVNWNNMGEMTIHVFQLAWDRATTKNLPTALLSSCCAVTGILFLLQFIFAEISSGFIDSKKQD